MFLITIQFTTSERNGIRHSGTQRYAKTTRREMSDWCHTVKRIFLANGWQLTRQTMAELSRADLNETGHQAPNPYQDCGLAPTMRFGRPGTAVIPAFIELIIEECGQESAVEAANRFLR